MALNGLNCKCCITSCADFVEVSPVTLEANLENLFQLDNLVLSFKVKCIFKALDVFLFVVVVLCL